MTLHLSKPGLRALGIAESFVRSRPTSILAGVVMRADLRADALAYASARVGGDDATDAVLEIYRRLDRPDINVILIEGALISWFNIIDLDEVWQKTERPVICITYQDSSGLEGHIRAHFQSPEEKIRRYRKLGERQKIWLKTGYEVYLRIYGATPEEAGLLLSKFTFDGRVPEPLRLAGLAARAAHRLEGRQG
jgi:uncharacterized protein